MTNIFITPEAKSWIGELRESLHAFYLKIGKNLSDRDLMVAIEHHFGEEILQKVCIPYGLFEGACLIIAMEVAKEAKKDLQENK